MTWHRTAAVVVLIGFLIVPFSGIEGASWQSYKSEHFIFYYKDTEIKGDIERLATENENFLSFLRSTMSCTRELETIHSYIFPSWPSALRENFNLPEEAVWNIYEEGVFERSNEKSLMVRKLVGDSVSFLQNGLMSMLLLSFRGLDPHLPAQLYFSVGDFVLPEELMFRQSAQQSIATSASFLAYLLENYGPSKLAELLNRLNDESYFTFPEALERTYGKKILTLSSDWKTYLQMRAWSSPKEYTAQEFYEVSQFVNVASLRFFIWQDYINFGDIMKDVGLLYYYFERLDIKNSRIYMERLKEDEEYGQWEADRPKRIVMWSGIGVGVLLIGLFVLYLRKLNQRRKARIAFIASLKPQQEAFDQFLKEKRSKD